MSCRLMRRECWHKSNLRSTWVQRKDKDFWMLLGNKTLKYSTKIKCTHLYNMMDPKLWCKIQVLSRSEILVETPKETIHKVEMISWTKALDKCLILEVMVEISVCPVLVEVRHFYSKVEQLSLVKISLLVSQDIQRKFIQFKEIF